MDNVRKITSAKKAPLPIKAENAEIKTYKKRKPNILTQEMQNLIAAQMNASIAAATATAAETKKSFWKKFSEYIGLKMIVQLIIGGIITATGGAIVTFKWSQIYSYASFIPNVTQAKGAFNEMYSLCYEHKTLNADQKEKFIKNKDDFDKYTKNIFNSGYYGFKRVLFGKDISAKQTEISNQLMNIDTMLTDCSSIKALNPASLDTKEADLVTDMLRSIGLRWPPFLF